eukprot:jgi/Botrbrau1/5213/Bobra.0172s0077.1
MFEVELQRSEGMEWPSTSRVLTGKGEGHKTCSDVMCVAIFPGKATRRFSQTSYSTSVVAYATPVLIPTGQRVSCRN